MEDNNITMFISNQLDVCRLFKNKENPELNEIEIKVKKNEDLVITGLGFIKFTKDETIKVSVLKGVKVFTRKSLV